jgi:hypothetical protein
VLQLRRPAQNLNPLRLMTLETRLKVTRFANAVRKCKEVCKIHFAMCAYRSTPPAAAALRSGLGTKNLSLWTVIGAAPKSSGFRWWTQAGDGAGLRRRSSRSLWRAFRVPARSRQRHGDTAFRGRCCCDGADTRAPQATQCYPHPSRQTPWQLSEKL